MSERRFAGTERFVCGADVVAKTRIGNHYGALNLLKDPNGHYWVSIEDFSGFDSEGPLSADQIEAFYRLFPYTEEPKEAGE